MMKLQNEVVVHERVESVKVLSAQSSNHSIILNEGSFDEVEDFDEFKHNLLKNQTKFNIQPQNEMSSKSIHNAEWPYLGNRAPEVNHRVPVENYAEPL